MLHVLALSNVISHHGHIGQELLVVTLTEGSFMVKHHCLARNTFGRGKFQLTASFPFLDGLIRSLAMTEEQQCSENGSMSAQEPISEWTVRTGA